MVNTLSIPKSLKITRRDVRSFAVATVLFTSVLSAGVGIDTHYNGGRIASAITHHDRVIASADLCSMSKFTR